MLAYHFVSCWRITLCHVAVSLCVMLPCHFVSCCRITLCHVGVSLCVMLPSHFVLCWRITLCHVAVSLCVMLPSHFVLCCRITLCQVAVLHRIVTDRVTDSASSLRSPWLLCFYCHIGVSLNVMIIVVSHNVVLLHHPLSYCITQCHIIASHSVILYYHAVLCW